MPAIVLDTAKAGGTHEMKRLASILLIVVVSLGLLLPEPAQADFSGLPPGLVDSPVTGGLGAPNAFDWLPNGDILIASQSGVVSRWDGATLTPALNIAGAVCGNGEMGLLGLAVDPDFGAGQDFVYLYYTHRRGGGNCGDHRDRANRVSRFAVDGSGNLGGEDVLIDNIPAFAANHHAGDLHFDNNDLLYVSVGDSGRDLHTGQGEPNNGNSRRLDLLNGKILRITRDGAIPAGNPFPSGVVCSAAGMAPGAPVTALTSTEEDAKKKKKKPKKKKKKHKKKRHGKGKGGKKHNKGKKNKNRNGGKQNNRNRKKAADQPVAASAVCGEIFATGLRNPFRFAFDPDNNDAQQRFYINDVGGTAWEEINNGVAGADYGWNVREGPCVTGSTSNCPADPFVSPTFEYAHSAAAPFNGCSVITGGAFVPDGASVPAEFDDGDYLFADLGCARIFAFQGATAELFASAPPGAGAVHLGFGPDGALYYTTFQGSGEIRKIE